jgi:hypothetical protein
MISDMLFANRLPPSVHVTDIGKFKSKVEDEHSFEHAFRSKFDFD